LKKKFVKKKWAHSRARFKNLSIFPPFRPLIAKFRPGKGQNLKNFINFNPQKLTFRKVTIFFENFPSFAALFGFAQWKAKIFLFFGAGNGSTFFLRIFTSSRQVFPPFAGRESQAVEGRTILHFEKKFVKKKWAHSRARLKNFRASEGAYFFYEFFYSFFHFFPPFRHLIQKNSPVKGQNLKNFINFNPPKLTFRKVTIFLKIFPSFAALFSFAQWKAKFFFSFLAREWAHFFFTNFYGKMQNCLAFHWRRFSPSERRQNLTV